MKHVFLAAVGALFLFVSCRKGIEPIGQFQNPLSSDYQVVEYHKTYYDADLPPHFPYLFKKIYDPSGKTVKEILCSFEDVRSPQDLLALYAHDFKVSQHDLMIYLINKQLPKSNIPDTVACVKLNADGRAESCAVNTELAPDLAYGGTMTQTYIYKNNKVVAVKGTYTSPLYHPSIDSVRYDNNGNLLSFLTTRYEYDYTRKASQQFYCEGTTGSLEPFYLLQYLGFFPEVNNPTNVCISYTDVESKILLSNHRFDRENRLVGYDDEIFGATSITWK